jgi:ring-1,2-phenylacetyl-CoA epoxidase subunit PaaA
MKQRRDADETGAWVREAALVYARKRRARAEAAARVAAE